MLLYDVHGNFGNYQTNDPQFRKSWICSTAGLYLIKYKYTYTIKSVCVYVYWSIRNINRWCTLIISYYT